MHNLAVAYGNLGHNAHLAEMHSPTLDVQGLATASSSLGRNVEAAEIHGRRVEGRAGTDGAVSCEGWGGR